MKCPHCSYKLHFFSKALNKFGNPKTCPKCDKKIKLSPNYKMFAWLIVPAYLVHLFILKPLVIAAGFSGSGIAGIWGALLILFTLQLHSTEQQ